MSRLVLVAPVFPQLSETFLVSKVLGLLRRGWDLHVVCGSSPARAWAAFPELNAWPGIRARVHPAWPHRPRALAAALAPLAAGRALLAAPRRGARYLRRGAAHHGLGLPRWLYLDAELIRLAPDLLHFAFGSLARERLHLRRLLGCPLGVSFRGFDLDVRGLHDPRHYAALWAEADAIHLLSRRSWERAQARGCPSARAHRVIPPAVDLARFDPGERPARGVLGSPARPLRLLCVGRLHWSKGGEYALGALAALRRRGVQAHLRFLGDGPARPALGFARHQLGLEDAVEFLGAQPSARVPAEMRRADVLLHPSVTEAFGNAVLEAQAMALPVVCSDAGGLPENVVDGETGLIAPRRDPTALAEHLATLAGDSALRARLGAAGRARVRKHFGLEQQGAAWDAFFRDVLAGPEPEGPSDEAPPAL